MNLIVKFIINKTKRKNFQLGNNWCMVDHTGLMFYLFFMKKPVYIQI